MNKVLIEVTSPAAGQTFDMFVPDTIQIGEMISLIGNVFAQTSNGIYSKTSSMVLSEKKTGYVFDLNKTIKDSNIRNGSKLLLF